MIQIITDGTVGVHFGNRLAAMTRADGAFSAKKDVEDMLVREGVAQFVDDLADDDFDDEDFEDEEEVFETEDDSDESEEAEPTPKQATKSSKTAKSSRKETAKTESSDEKAESEAQPPVIDASGVVE